MNKCEEKNLGQDNLARIAGSFRDPESYVFCKDGTILRWMSDRCWSDYQRCVDAGLSQRLVDDGLMVGVMPYDAADGFPAGVTGGHLLQHERIEFISYPYEWSFSMLADAALLQLRLHRRLLEHGLSLKDASAYNIQFRGSRPVFIDWGSIEVPEHLGLWDAYGQFCRMFLFPLILKQERGVSFVQSFIGDIGGVEVGQAHKVLGSFRSFAPRNFIDVYLQHALSKKTTQDARKMKTEINTRATDNVNAQLLNVDRLQRKVTKLSRKFRVSGLWSEYGEIRNYDDTALADKHEFVSRFLQRYKPDVVVDIGCNTGEFSVLAAESGSKVIAMDSDSDAVEMLYRRAKKEKLTILPLVANVAVPSPGIGLFNEERTPLSERIEGDAVFALALLHHLLVSAQIPLKDIGRVLSSYTRRFLIMEYVDPADEMFETLLSIRKNYFSDLTKDRVVQALSESFELLEEQPIRHSKRQLLLFQKKA